jgi:hypothetical protein
MARPEATVMDTQEKLITIPAEAAIEATAPGWRASCRNGDRGRLIRMANEVIVPAAT